jgi:hypothetical protein
MRIKTALRSNVNPDILPSGSRERRKPICGDICFTSRFDTGPVCEFCAAL